MTSLPLPLCSPDVCGADGVGLTGVLRAGCVVSFLWVWCSMCICVIYPVVESTGALGQIGRGLGADIGALVGRRKAKVGAAEEAGGA